MSWRRNRIEICMDTQDNGRIYVSGSGEKEFFGVEQLLLLLDKTLDATKGPRASETKRSFNKNENTQARDAMENDSDEPQNSDVVEVEKIRGKKANFVLCVKYRQCTSFQGELFWEEGQTTEEFHSEIDLLRLFWDVFNI